MKSLFFNKKGEKWGRGDIENPTFATDTPKTSVSITQDAISVNISKNIYIINGQFSFHIHVLQGEKVRFEYHKCFLKQCYNEKTVPHGYECY